MALRRGLFVRKDKQAGTSPADARMALAGLFAANGEISARPGVLPAPGNTPIVTGTSGWEYLIAPRHFVTSRGASDGVTIAANDGPVSVATTPAPQTGSRYDVVWVRHQDTDSPWNDASSEPEFGVTSGTPSATPSVPVDGALPKGALRLANVLIKAGAKSTLGSQVIFTIVVPFTSSRSGQVVVRNQTERDLLTSLASTTNPIEVFRSDTGNIEWSNGNGWRSSSSVSEFFEPGWDTPVRISSQATSVLAGSVPPASATPFMQCGTTVGVTDALSYVRVVFPKPFKNALFTFVAMAADTGSAGYFRLASRSHWPPLTTDVVVQAILPNGAGAAGHTVVINWIAIGA